MPSPTEESPARRPAAPREAARSHSCRGRRPDPGKRQAIVDAAFSLFFDQGYGVSMETIAAKAGVAKQTLYNLFSTKEQLFGASVEKCSKIVLQALVEAREDTPPREVLTGIAEDLLNLWRDDRIARAYRMMMSAVIEADGVAEICRQFYDNGPGRSTLQFAAYLARQDEIGHLAVPDPMLAAESFFGTLNGFMVIRNMLGLQRSWDEATLRRKAAYTVNAFLAAHAPGSVLR